MTNEPKVPELITYFHDGDILPSAFTASHPLAKLPRTEYVPAARIAELEAAYQAARDETYRMAVTATEANARAEAAEAKLAKADALAAECERAFDDVDGTGTQEFYLALYTYTDSRATLADLQKPIATRDDPA